MPKAKDLLLAKSPRHPARLPFAAPEPFVWLARDDGAGNFIRTEVLAESGKGMKLGLRITETKVEGLPAHRLFMAVSLPRKKEHLAAFGVEVPFAHAGNPRRVQVHAAGAFRVERWRVDQSDEKIPGWLNSDRRTRWPMWRGGGILLGPGDSYRIFKESMPTCSPLFVDQGFKSPGWLDVTDRGGEARRGLTVRMLRSRNRSEGRLWLGVTFDYVRSRLVLWFHSPAGEPLDPGAGPIVAAADIIVHDGWRPPLMPPGLTEEQFRVFLDDLDYGGNIGLLALRFLLSETHQVKGDRYKKMLMQSGIEPREILLSMLWKDGLEKHCRRIGVRYDEKRPDATVERVIEHYQRR